MRYRYSILGGWCSALHALHVSLSQSHFHPNLFQKAEIKMAVNDEIKSNILNYYDLKPPIFDMSRKRSINILSESLVSGLTCFDCDGYWWI